MSLTKHTRLGHCNFFDLTNMWDLGRVSEKQYVLYCKISRKMIGLFRNISICPGICVRLIHVIRTRVLSFSKF